MKNKLPDLQNQLFAMIEALNDDSMDELDEEQFNKKIKRALTLNEIAKTAVANGALMAKCVDLVYGIPVSDDLPLIPKAEGETFLVDKKKKSLLSIPRNDGTEGYKRNKQQPI